MREFSESFIYALNCGFLAGIKNKVIEDKDLDLQIQPSRSLHGSDCARSAESFGVAQKFLSA